MGTIAALLGSISANTPKEYLKDEMTSLLNLVEKVETQNSDEVLDAVDARK